MARKTAGRAATAAKGTRRTAQPSLRGVLKAIDDAETKLRAYGQKHGRDRIRDPLRFLSGLKELVSSICRPAAARDEPQAVPRSLFDD
jgi:hypothetical protein